MVEKSIIDGIVIGGAGGALAGITVYVIQFIQTLIRDQHHKKRVFNWLKENTKDSEPGYRSTRAIASWNNLTEDRVRYVCSIDKKIHLSTGTTPDMWGVNPRPARGNSRDLL